MTSHAGIEVELLPLPPLETLQRWWRALELRSNGSFFLTWTWISAWLELCAADADFGRDARLLRARVGDGIVGLGILRRLATGPGRRAELFLHQSGRADLDSVFIEYNGFLVDRAHGPAARDALLTFLEQPPNPALRWDAFRVAGADAPMRDALQTTPWAIRARPRLCPWVDLERISPGLDGYLSAVSRNTRQQIRRSFRLCQPMTLKVARTADETAMALSRLQNLHEAAWLGRTGTRGAFAHPHFARFLRALIDNAGNGQTVDLVTVAAGEMPVGILANFTHAGHVYAYQSGFSYSEDPRIKPGLMSHAQAVAHYREQGMRAYHFMAGEGQYKTSLGTDTEELEWVVARPRSPAALVEHAFGALREWGAAQWKNVADRAARIRS